MESLPIIIDYNAATNNVLTVTDCSIVEVYQSILFYIIPLGTCKEAKSVKQGVMLQTNNLD